MSLLRHIERCNRFDPSRFLPLLLGSRRIGFVRRDNAALLARFPDVFAVTEETIRLVAPGGFEALSDAVDRVVEELIRGGHLAKRRHEYFPVAPRWGEAPLLKLDRSAVTFFGIRAYGVHVNGWVGDRAGRAPTKLWIGRRAPDKAVEPDKLDNMVAGGIGIDHGLAETLVKEAAEEADLPAALVAQAIRVGAITYLMETERGARDDVLFVYDLDTPPDVVPRNTDGEIVAFTLLDIREVLERIRRNNEFKFNVTLVIIDFALRHGIIGPEDPDYLDLVTGLRRKLD